MGFYFLAFLLAFTSGLSASEIKLSRAQQTPKTLYALRSLSGVYTRKMLVAELRDFVSNSGATRFVGAPNHQSVGDQLLTRMKAIANGVGEVSVHSFSPDVSYAESQYEANFNDQIKGLLKESDPEYKKLRAYTDQMKATVLAQKNQTGRNFIWERKGSDPKAEVLILGANYDSLSLDQKTLKLDPKASAPGADDNASGVAIGLGLIEILSRIELPKTVRIIFFDYGELHALGSRSYVKEKLGDQKIAGFINLLMLGHDSAITDKKEKTGNMKLYIQKPDAKTHGHDLKFASYILEMGSEISTSVHAKIEDNALPVRDNVSFWQAGIPALVFTGDWEQDFNPRNHTSDDFVETLNQRSLYNNYKFALSSIIGWAYDIVP